MVINRDEWRSVGALGGTGVLYRKPRWQWQWDSYIKEGDASWICGVRWDAWGKAFRKIFLGLAYYRKSKIKVNSKSKRQRKITKAISFGHTDYPQFDR